MNLNTALLIFNTIIAAFSSIYMLYYGIYIYSKHSPIRRITYVIIGLALFYHAAIYILALSGAISYVELSTEKVEFASFVRPFASVYLLAPIALDAVQRKFGGIK